MTKKILLAVTALFLLIKLNAETNPPKRKAIMGGVVSMNKEQLKVDSVIPASTFEAMGIKKNDLILKLNDKPVTSVDSYNEIASSIRAEDKVTVAVERDGKQITKSGNAIMRPYEVNEFADINYDWLPFKEGAVRIITKKPKNKTNCPCILFIPGYNCSSIDNFPNNYNGKLMNEWIKAGYAIVCVEKSGNGDSYGCKPCVEVDLQTDIDIYSKAYQYMQQLSFADKQNLFIWGHSMGGVIAPVIAEKFQPKGVMAFATVFRPWSEFLLEMHRGQYPLDGKSYTETEKDVRLMHKIYYEFFVLKRTPDELVKNPEYKSLVERELEYKPGKTNMWGRDWHFWMQIDSLDLAASWSKVNGKVLSIFGGADFIACSELEHKLMVETVNNSHPGNATYLRIENIDHIMAKNNSWKESSDHLYDKKYQSENFNYEISKKTIEWLDGMCKQ